MNSLEVKILKKRKEAADIVSLELVDMAGKPLPKFSPGSHIDVYLPNGLVRQYSLWNDSSRSNRYRIAVLREPNSRGGSAAVHNLINEGDSLLISRPKNNFKLVEAEKTLLFAGGIGVTPLLSMAYRLHRDNADFVLHYSARSRKRMAFRDLILNSDFSDRVNFYFDDEKDRDLDINQCLKIPKNNVHIYICGPKGYIDFVLKAARNLGWAEEQLHVEFFSAEEVDTTGDTAFKLKLAKSGSVLTVPADRTVADVLKENGVFIPVSCEQGMCGTCLTKVIEGVPEHRDVYLTDEERASNTLFTPCCSRSKTPVLVIEL